VRVADIGEGDEAQRTPRTSRLTLALLAVVALGAGLELVPGAWPTFPGWSAAGPGVMAVAAVVLLTAGSLRAWRPARLAPSTDAPLEVVRVELVALREENAKLRLDQQRALSLGRATERIRDAVDAVAVGDEAEAASWDALTEATVMRTALLAACQDLQTAVGHMERRLSTQIAGPEIDRRLRDMGDTPWVGDADRRAKPSGGGADAGSGERRRAVAAWFAARRPPDLYGGPLVDLTDAARAAVGPVLYPSGPPTGTCPVHINSEATSCTASSASAECSAAVSREEALET